MNHQHLDLFDEFDLDTPSTSTMHDLCFITQPDEDIDINIMDSDEDVSLALRQTETHLNPISKSIVSKRANEDNVEEQYLTYRGNDRKSKKIALLEQEVSIQLAALRRANKARAFYIETDNSDDEEIDVVNLPTTKMGKHVERLMLECKVHMNHKLSFYRKFQNEAMQQGNVQEEEQIDVVNDIPSSSNRQLTRKKVKHSKNPNNMEERRRKSARNHEDEEIDVVNVSSSPDTISNLSPTLNSAMRQSYSLRKRLQTRNLRAAVVTTPPPVMTIDLSNSIYGEADNSNIIELNDSPMHSSSDVIIVEDTSDEFSPVKESSNTRRFGLGDCPVCLEDLSKKEIMSTICGHVFCSPCIKGVIKTNKKCPNCRKILTLKSIHPLFI